MTTQTYQKVTSVLSTLHATHLQTTLEQAGIPARVTRAQAGAGLDVLVPAARAEQAARLFNAKPRAGEIFCVPGAELD